MSSQPYPCSAEKLQQLYARQTKITETIDKLNNELNDLRWQIHETRYNVMIEEKHAQNKPLLQLLNLPDNVYVPKTFEIGITRGMAVNSYHVNYDGICFRLPHRPDQFYPKGFDISVNDEVICSPFDPVFKIPFLVQVYYQHPNKVQNYSSEPLVENLETCIDKAKQILDGKWKHELSFGIAMMYYWIRIFYQPKKYAQQLDGPLYADLCRQFTMDD